MARNRQVIVDQDEDIVFYEHHLVARFVRVMVGFGTTLPDGSFVASEDQNYENYVLQGVAYDALMAATDTKPAGVFRKEDLWQFIDIGRQKILEERQAIAEQQLAQIAQAAQDAAPVDPGNQAKKNV